MFSVVFSSRNALSDAMILAWYVYFCVLGARLCFRFDSPCCAYRAPFLYVLKTYFYVLVNSDGQYPSLFLAIRYVFRVFRSLAPITVVSCSRFVIDSFYSLLSVVSRTFYVNHIIFASSASFASFACFVWSVWCVWCVWCVCPYLVLIARTCSMQWALVLKGSLLPLIIISRLQDPC
jgi:hypothetical protein